MEDKEVIKSLVQQLDGMRTILNTLLHRSNDVIVLLDKHRRKYHELVQEVGQHPVIDVQQNEQGDLTVTLVRDSAAMQETRRLEHRDMISNALSNNGIEVSEELLNRLETNKEDSDATIRWIGQKIRNTAAKASGAEIEEQLPMPSFLKLVDIAPVV